MNLDHDKSNLLINSVTCDFFVNERLTKVLCAGHFEYKMYCTFLFFKDDLGHYMGAFSAYKTYCLLHLSAFSIFYVCSNQCYFNAHNCLLKLSHLFFTL